MDIQVDWFSRLPSFLGVFCEVYDEVSRHANEKC